MNGDAKEDEWWWRWRLCLGASVVSVKDENDLSKIKIRDRGAFETKWEVDRVDLSDSGWWSVLLRSERIWRGQHYHDMDILIANLVINIYEHVLWITSSNHHGCCHHDLALFYSFPSLRLHRAILTIPAHQVDRLGAVDRYTARKTSNLLSLNRHTYFLFTKYSVLKFATVCNTFLVKCLIFRISNISQSRFTFIPLLHSRLRTLLYFTFSSPHLNHFDFIFSLCRPYVDPKAQYFF